MDVKLDAIIEKIKQDAIHKGRDEAEKTINEARKEAEKIINDATLQAADIVSQAQRQSDTIHERGLAALQLAKRDVLLSAKDELSELFSNLLRQRVKELLNYENLLDLLKTALEKWKIDSHESLFVFVSSDHAQKLLSQGMNDLLSHNKKIEIRVDEQISHGFMISLDDQGAVKYDFSDQALGESLAVYLTQNIRELLN